MHMSLHTVIFSSSAPPSIKCPPPTFWSFPISQNISQLIAHGRLIGTIFLQVRTIFILQKSWKIENKTFNRKMVSALYQFARS